MSWSCTPRVFGMVCLEPWVIQSTCCLVKFGEMMWNGWLNMAKAGQKRIFPWFSFHFGPGFTPVLWTLVPKIILWPHVFLPMLKHVKTKVKPPGGAIKTYYELMVPIDFPHKIDVIAMTLSQQIGSSSGPPSQLHIPGWSSLSPSSHSGGSLTRGGSSPMLKGQGSHDNLMVV